MLLPQIARLDGPILRSLTMDNVETVDCPSKVDWLWHGFIARRNITLLTSQWKAGKTTLLTGLLQSFAAGGKFLERAVAPTHALVVSEESQNTWADRLRRMPVGKHCRLLARPFPRRPSPEEWDRLIDHALELQAVGELDLLVIDPLAKFLPGATESDLNALFRMLDPLQRLTEAGAAVTILHHPRKKASEEGCAARGSGGLLAAVDIIVELSGHGAIRSDEYRRKLFAMSRYVETPRRLVYEWNPATTRFAALGDLQSIRFNENWELLLAILKKRTKASTHLELLMDWPADRERPSPATLYEWLNRAHEDKRLRREGTGRKSDPYRYRLEDEDDEYRDRGELPPLRDLPWLGD